MSISPSVKKNTVLQKEPTDQLVNNTSKLTFAFILGFKLSVI